MAIDHLNLSSNNCTANAGLMFRGSGLRNFNEHMSILYRSWKPPRAQFIFTTQIVFGVCMKSVELEMSNNPDALGA